MDPNMLFCRTLFVLACQDLTGNELKHFRENVGCLKCNTFGGANSYYLVEWPKMNKEGRTFVWEGEAYNANEAKAKAINVWLQDHAPTVRANIRLHGWESVK